MKNKLVFVGLAIFVLAIGILAVGCASMGDGSSRPKIQTIKFEPIDDGWIRYFTNDNAMVDDGNGKQFKNPNSDPNVYEMDVKMISGGETHQLGMDFGAASGNYYRIELRLKGDYRLSKTVGGNWSTLNDWTETDQFNKGLGVVNTVKAVKNGDVYDIYLNANATPLYTVTDTSVKGNGMGYRVNIRGEKNLPDVPFEVWFKAK